MFTVIFTEEAIDDLDIAIEYYTNISSQLAKRFSENFDKSSLELENIPFFQIRYDEMRVRKISKFPLLLHFTITEK